MLEAYSGACANIAIFAGGTSFALAFLVRLQSVYGAGGENTNSSWKADKTSGVSNFAG